MERRKRSPESIKLEGKGKDGGGKKGPVREKSERRPLPLSANKHLHSQTLQTLFLLWQILFFLSDLLKDNETRRIKDE